MTSSSATPADRLPSTPESATPAVSAMHAVERSASLDAVATLVDAASRLLAPGAVAPLLQGRGSGHALHPFLTDVPIGLWISTSVLDLAGGPGSRRAAQRLVGLGVVGAAPALVTGLAEWRHLSRPERRVAVLHAGCNAVALAGYGFSYALRRRGRHGAGAGLALAAMGVAGASGYLGGHLAVARKVGSRDAGFERDGVGPLLARG